MENFIKKQLEAELERNVAQQYKIIDEIGVIRGVQNNLQSIAEQPERPHSFFQVNSLAYVPATIIHTGEQYVTLGNLGQILMTTQETQSFLQRKIERLESVLNLFRDENSQLHKRQEIFLGENEEISKDVADMPAEIPSDVGTAYKTSTGVFDIIEPYKEEERKPVKSTKQSEEVGETMKDDNWYMKRLEELEREENGITSVKEEYTAEDVTVLNKAKMIIRECGLYERLAEDSDIKGFCDVAYEDGVNILNWIIIKALERESTSALIYSNNDPSRESEKNENVSENELQALAYLDLIEKNL